MMEQLEEQTMLLALDYVYHRMKVQAPVPNELPSCLIDLGNELEAIYGENLTLMAHIMQSEGGATLTELSASLDRILDEIVFFDEKEPT